MRVLGVGHYLDLGDLYLRLVRDGCEVRVFADDAAGVYEGMLTRIGDWRSELEWVGRDGLVLFEGSGFGHEQDALRGEGFFVVGGSEFGDRLERDRAFGQEVLRDSGLCVAPNHEFDDWREGIEYVKRNPRRYVLKLSGDGWASWRNHIGALEDGADVIAVLELHRRKRGDERTRFVLMDHLEGVEIGVGGYFNGHDFLRPTCLDWEHKRFFDGDLGELTGEMGTLVTYRGGEKFFESTLAKLTVRLREAGHVGYVNLNTIVNERGIFPLEVTSRFGYPGFAILSALQPAGWRDLFDRMRRDADTFPTGDGFAVGVVLTVPPFPYATGYDQMSRGMPIVLSDAWSAADDLHLHHSEVALENGQLVTSGQVGYVSVVTGVGQSAASARNDAYRRVAKVVIPNMRYRQDIGARFIERDQVRLVNLGVL